MRLNSDLPTKLDEIINKSLEKDRSLRYQHAADLRADLQRLKRDYDSTRRAGTPVADALSPSGSATAAATTSGGSEGIAVSQGVSSSAASSVQRGSSSVVEVAREHKFGVAVIAMVALLLATAAGYGIYSLVDRSRTLPFQNFEVSQLTETGKTVQTAISPDGKFLVNVQEKWRAQRVVAKYPERQRQASRCPHGTKFRDARILSRRQLHLLSRDSSGGLQYVQFISRARSRWHT